MRLCTQCIWREGVERNDGETLNYCSFYRTYSEVDGSIVRGSVACSQARDSGAYNKPACEGRFWERRPEIRSVVPTEDAHWEEEFPPPQSMQRRHNG